MFLTKITVLVVLIINAGQSSGRRLSRDAEEEYVQADDELTETTEEEQVKDQEEEYVEPEFDENFVTFDEVDDDAIDYNQVDEVDEDNEVDENRPNGESLEEWLYGFEPIEECEEDETGLCFYQVLADIS